MNAYITEADAAEIKRLFYECDFSIRQIASRGYASRGTISAILKDKWTPARKAKPATERTPGAGPIQICPLCRRRIGTPCPACIARVVKRPPIRKRDEDISLNLDLDEERQRLYEEVRKMKEEEKPPPVELTAYAYGGGVLTPCIAPFPLEEEGDGKQA